MSVNPEVRIRSTPPNNLSAALIEHVRSSRTEAAATDGGALLGRLIRPKPVRVATDAPRTPHESPLKSPSEPPKFAVGLVTANFGDGRSLNYFVQIVFRVLFDRVESPQVPPFTG